MSSDPEIDFPRGTSDERELFLRWLNFLRGAVIRKVEDLSDEQARWKPDAALTSVPRLGVVAAGRQRYFDSDDLKQGRLCRCGWSALQL